MMDEDLEYGVRDKDRDQWTSANLRLSSLKCKPIQ